MKFLRVNRSSITLLVVVGVIIAIAILLQLLHQRPDSYSNDISDIRVRQLFDEAKEKIAAEQIDSAIKTYSIVAMTQPNSGDSRITKHQAAAFNNIGYAQLYGKQDYINSYANFLHALSLAQSTQYSELMPYIYINLANVDVEYDPQEALNKYKQAYSSAIRVSNRTVMHIALNNMINLALSEDMISDISDELEKYTPIDNDSTMLSSFTRYNYKGAIMMKRRQYDRARNSFVEASKHIDTDLTPGRYKIQALGNCAMAMLCDGDTIAALRVFNDIDRESYKEHTNRVRCNIYKMLSGIYHRLGDESAYRTYHYRYLELSDSIYNFSLGYALKNVESQNSIDRINREYQELGKNYEKMQIVTWCVMAVLAIILCFSIITYLNKRRQERLLKSLYIQNQRLQQLQKAEMESASKNLQNTPTVSPSSESSKYQSSTLTAQEKEIYAQRITSIAESSDRIYEIGFTIEQLAEMVELREKIVSQVINEMWHLNFNAWLNVYRCREASRRLSSPEFAAMTIEAVAESVGFRNRSHFASVFKSATGMTPAEYRRAARLV
ncbi:MAG: helix-turn-helix domain-containing protein [Lepagella sp.]